MATSKSTVLDFLAQRANIAGCVTACAAMVGGITLDLGTLVTLGIGVGGYVAAFLLFGSSGRNITIVQGSDEVEVRTIQANLSKLRSNLDEHRKRIPDEILDASEGIFTLVEEIIPRWKELSSFGDQKYVINSIITEYFPASITNYMNLPQSYYRNGVKNKAGEAMLEQLGILRKTLEGIRDGLYAGVEKDIELQSQFLKDKFLTPNADGLRLQ